jgi:ABC-2 type transport system permease protein
MNKTWIVFKTEFINTVTRRSFLIMLILVPLVPALILGGVSLFKDEDSDGGITGMFQPDETVEVHEGYIDQAGIITEIPDWITEDRLTAYPDVETARRDTLSGKLTGYYVIQPDYIEDGTMLYFRDDFNPINGFDSTHIINELINYNLLGADQSLYAAYQNPIHLEMIDIEPEVIELDQSNPLSYYIPYVITFLLYFVIINSASLMLASVAKEKENQAIEIILSSIKPEQLLTGKILGLGLVGLLQTVVWMGSALLILKLGGTTLEIPAGLQLPPEILVWGVVFFILGYLLYAAIMAGIGALVPKLKEASQATIFVVLPAVVPLMMINEIVGQPDSTLSIALSLIPFTASSTIVTRLTVTAIPAWQIIASIGLLVLAIVFMIRAVAKMFRAQNLLTGKKFSFGLFLRVLIGKENTSN